MRALEKIVDLLASSELGIINESESVLFSLIEVYAEENGFDVLKNLTLRIKSSRVDIAGRRRRDLKDIALAMKVNVFSESRMQRQTPKIDSSVLKQILGVENVK